MKKIIIFIVGFAVLVGGIMFVTNKEKDNTANYYKNQITDEQLTDVLNKKEEKIIYYYQPSCTHCTKVSPIIIPMAEKMGIKVEVLNLQEYQKGWDTFKIEGTPTLAHYKDGKEVARLVGEHETAEFEKWFKDNKF